MRAQHSHWYYMPLIPAIYIFSGRAFQEFLDKIPEMKNSKNYNLAERGVLIIPFLFIIFFAFNFIRNYDKLGEADTTSKVHIYKKAGIWLHENVSPDSKVMLSEILDNLFFRIY